MPTTRLASALTACAFALTLSAGSTIRIAEASEPAPPTEMAAIEATAPLHDVSEEAVKAAITAAVQKAARGALAMGLPWLQVQSAYVRAGYVGVHVVAMTKPPQDDDAGAPGAIGPPIDPGDDAAPPERAPDAARKITL